MWSVLVYVNTVFVLQKCTFCFKWQAGQCRPAWNSEGIYGIKKSLVVGWGWVQQQSTLERMVLCCWCFGFFVLVCWCSWSVICDFFLRRFLHCFITATIVQSWMCHCPEVHDCKADGRFLVMSYHHQHFCLTRTPSTVLVKYVKQHCLSSYLFSAWLHSFSNFNLFL